jgi:Ran GTPase-activating protein (RanGAP) involved in mRNA processing and transport
LEQAKKLGEFVDVNALKKNVIGHDGLPVQYSQQRTLDEMLKNNTNAVVDQLRAHPDGKLDYLRGLNLGAATQLFLPLRVTHSITMLDLEGSKLGDLGATEVAKALRGNISIANINLNSNQIDSQGATSLAEAVGVSNVLQRIDLGRNRIGNDGALALASALRRNRSLRTLLVDENGIRDSGAIELLHAIEHIGKLTTFSVSEASLSNASAAVLAQLMAKSEFSLCDIRWTGKQIDASGASLLSDAMLSNNRVFNFHPWQAQNEAIRDVCQVSSAFSLC